MNPNEPPPARRIEIVPLGDQTAPGRPLPPRSSAAAPLRPLPAWPPPAVRTTAHPAQRATLPEDVVIDLTSLVPATAAVQIDLTDDTPRAPEPAAVAAVAPGAGAEPSSLDLRRARLRALLDAERAELENHASVVALRPQALPDLAPFPIPGPQGRIVLPDTAAPVAPGDVADSAEPGEPGVVLRRVPKAVRPDGAGRPLSGDVAAAIHRLTGRQLPPPPPPPVTRRIEIVPLDPPLAPVVHLTPPTAAEPAVIDLRDDAHACPACHAPGRSDVVDHIAHTVHLTCTNCFRMWTEPLGEND